MEMNLSKLVAESPSMKRSFNQETDCCPAALNKNRDPPPRPAGIQNIKGYETHWRS